MNLKDYLMTLYDYNDWANHRYLAVAETLTEEQLFRKQGHSWDSVYRVLLHMLSSEWMWLERWQGRSPQVFLEPKDFPTLASIKTYWIELEPKVGAFIHTQTEESLLADVSYTNPRGEIFILPIWNMIAQVPNHNTHHRGELAAMFTLMNVPHPEEEVIQYFLDRSGQKKF
jgi:uncharacterized damage-inducible protein DinB